MHDLITDLDTIKRLAEECWEENVRFRSFINDRLDWTDERLDAEVREILEQVIAGIDCTECANCCRVFGLQVRNSDMPRLSRALGLTPEELKERYLMANEHSEMMIREMPCPFLSGNICSVYDGRLKDCRDFPNLHRPRFRSRTMQFLRNTAECPMVFNVWELLKERVDFST